MVNDYMQSTVFNTVETLNQHFQLYNYDVLRCWAINASMQFILVLGLQSITMMSRSEFIVAIKQCVFTLLIYASWLYIQTVRCPSVFALLIWQS